MTHTDIGFHTIVVGLLISARFIGIGTPSMMKEGFVVGFIYSPHLISVVLTVQPYKHRKMDDKDGLGGEKL